MKNQFVKLILIIIVSSNLSSCGDSDNQKETEKLVDTPIVSPKKKPDTLISPSVDKDAVLYAEGTYTLLNTTDDPKYVDKKILIKLIAKNKIKIKTSCVGIFCK
jgi:hypothetical protein